MELRKVIAFVATAALLSLPAFAAPQNPQGGFSALQGVEVQALSVEEMQAISGELNAYDIAAALHAKAATLDAFPELQAFVVKVAYYYTNYATVINAFFAKFGVLTPCRSCAP
jgi:hypothetical protein